MPPSPQSVEQGAAWFRAYLGNETEGTPEHEWATVAGTAIALTAIVLAIAPLLLDGYAGWPLFGHAILLGGGAAYGSFAGGAMLSQLIGGRVFQARLLSNMSLVIVIIFFLTVLYRYGVLAGIGVGLGVIPVLRLMVVIESEFEKLAIVPLILIPYCIALWLMSIVVRFVVTIAHARTGCRRIADNWCHALLVVDLFHPPELIPGMKAGEGAQIQDIIKGWSSAETYLRVTAAVVAPIWFAPALFYRWSLKSTCWLYLPLIYLFWPRCGSKEDDRLMLDKLYDSRWENLRRLLALAVVASAAMATLHIDQWLALKTAFPQAPMLFSLWAFDLRALAPWQWFSLVTAAATFYLYFHTDDLLKVLKVRETVAPMAEEVRRLLLLQRVRYLCTVAFYVLALGYVVVALERIDLQSLPPTLSFLAALYGPYL